MRISYFDAHICIEIGCSECDDNIDQEKKVDHGIDKGDEVARNPGGPMVAIEDGDRNRYGVVHSKGNDNQLPVADKLTIVSEDDLAITCLYGHLFLLIFEKRL